MAPEALLPIPEAELAGHPLAAEVGDVLLYQKAATETQ